MQGTVSIMIKNGPTIVFGFKGNLKTLDSVLISSLQHTYESSHRSNVNKTPPSQTFVNKSLLHFLWELRWNS